MSLKFVSCPIFVRDEDETACGMNCPFYRFHTDVDNTPVCLMPNLLDIPEISLRYVKGIAFRSEECLECEVKK